MDKIVALIPARSGSKGVINKNLRLLGGYSLLAWSIAVCLKSTKISRVIVSTDSLEYAQIARELGAEAPFLRPGEISGDNAIDYDFIIHALDWLSSEQGEPEYLVHIRPTTPLRDPAMIDKAIVKFIESPDATALRSVHEMSESAYKTFELTPGGQIKRLGVSDTALDAANDARQKFPKTYQANGYVDVLSTSFIRESGLIHGDQVIPFVTPRAFEVDEEEDLLYLQFQLSRSQEYLQRLFPPDP